MSGGASDDGFDSATANIRETVKWLIAAFAGSIAILIGTSPMTSLGALEPAHLTIALASGLIGIAAAFTAIHVALQILVAEPLFITNITDSKELSAFVDKIAKDVLPPTIETWQQFVDKRRELQDRLVQGETDAGVSSQYAAVVSVTSRVLSIVYFERQRRDFEKARFRLFVCAAVATVAFGYFSWSSNSALRHDEKAGNCFYCNVDRPATP